MRLAVVSDLHAWIDEPADAGYILNVKSEGNSRENPLEALLMFVSRLSLEADLLLCPGDLAHRADPDAMTYAWRKLEALREALGASLLASTAGNHDMDSRFLTTAFDPRDLLQTLDPPFPFSDGSEFDRYWARHFALRNMGDVRLVLVNSSAFHGYGSAGKSLELNHGRVTAKSVAWLTEALRAEQPAALNILVVHHHPQRYGAEHPNDVSEMQGAQFLLDILESGLYGPWLVIHGHRHWPWLNYAAGGGSSPIIFAAGSVSGTTFELPVRNQFYVIDVDPVAATALPLEVAGTFRAWDWSPLGSWVQAGRSSGLPWSGGFGCREPVPDLAIRIRDALARIAQPYATWKELEATDAFLRYLLPRDREHALRFLESRGEATFDIDEERGVIQVGAKP